MNPDRAAFSTAECRPATVSDCLLARLKAVSGRCCSLLRCSIGFLLALELALALPAWSGESIISHRTEAADFEDAALALQDAIVAEGISAPIVSEFGDMLQRTAPELGHAPDLYAEARIYTFCSARAAAALVAERRNQIALCPLSIALYRVDSDSPAVFFSYRRSADTPAGAAADALLGRIVHRAADILR